MIRMGPSGMAQGLWDIYACSRTEMGWHSTLRVQILSTGTDPVKVPASLPSLIARRVGLHATPLGRNGAWPSDRALCSPGWRRRPSASDRDTPEKKSGMTWKLSASATPVPADHRYLASSTPGQPSQACQDQLKKDKKARPEVTSRAGGATYRLVKKLK